MTRSLAVTAVVYLAVFVLVATPRSRAAASGPQGQDIFRYDTFGDEQLWTDTLQMQKALQNVPPATALAVGLKVDVDALPRDVVRALATGHVDLNSPATTALLLSMDAVVGVRARVNGSGTIESVGVTCALCHSTVDNSLTGGVGHRLDGWPNRDLNVGQIVALSDQLSPAQRAAVTSWGPGYYDPRLQAFDGHGFLALNSTTVPVLIPPAYGLSGVGFETYTADGPISYWNSYVGVSQMGGHGSFTDARLPLTIIQEPDQVTPKLPALLDYQLMLHAPNAPAHSLDARAAQRGARLFYSVARCSECHSGPTFTDVNSGGALPVLHSPEEVGQDSRYAMRTVTKMYRTSPLRGVWQHPPYFHDGSAADLLAVVEHYNQWFSLGLTLQQKLDLVEYLKSL